jgi:hypothetical protein
MPGLTEILLRPMPPPTSSIMTALAIVWVAVCVAYPGFGLMSVMVAGIALIIVGQSRNGRYLQPGTAAWLRAARWTGPGLIVLCVGTFLYLLGLD